MIITGILILLLSIINYDMLVSPLQTAYLQASTRHVQKIEIYSQSTADTKYLFSLATDQQINSLLDILHHSEPNSNWYHKIIPNDMGYLLKLYLSSGRTTMVYISLYENDHANVYLHNHYLAYSNDKLPSYIDMLYSRYPTMLTLNTIQNKSISLTNASLLSSLWCNVIWSTPIDATSIPDVAFNRPGFSNF